MSIHREILKWIQSLDLSYAVKNSKVDFNNGFLVAEILSRYYPSDMQMHSISNETRINRKIDNWQQISKLIKKKDISVKLDNIDDLIINKNNATLKFLRELYTAVTERKLPEPLVLYTKDPRTTQQESYLLKDKELTKLSQEELDMFKVEESKKDKEISPPKLKQQQDTDKKIVLSRGPQRVIPQNVEVDNIAQVEVNDIQIKTLATNIVQLRAEKEGFSYHIADKPSLQRSKPQNLSSNLEELAEKPQKEVSKPIINIPEESIPSSQMSSKNRDKDSPTPAERKRQMASDVINEILQNLLAEHSSELGKINVNNDLLNSVIYHLDILPEQISSSLFEYMNKQKEKIIEISMYSVNEFIVIYSMILGIMQKIRTNSVAFKNFRSLICSMASTIGSLPESDMTRKSFMELLISDLLGKMTMIMINKPDKIEALCELIFSHVISDVNERILVLRQVKVLLEKSQVTCFYALAKLLELEPSFNESIFDIYLYYGLSGISSPSPLIRTSALRILLNISKHNYESILGTVEKLRHLASDKYWEVPLVLIMISTSLLKWLEPFKDVLKSEEAPKSKALSTKGKAQLEKKVLKLKMEALLEIIEICLNTKSHWNVISKGIFFLIPIINIYKNLYTKLVDLLCIVDEQTHNLLVNPPNQKIKSSSGFLTLSGYSWEYDIEVDHSEIDKVILLRSLSDYITSKNFENLSIRQMSILYCCISKTVTPSELDSWVRVYRQMRDYLFVSLADPELNEKALQVIQKFLTISSVMETLLEESDKVLKSTLLLLHNKENAVDEKCKTTLLEYIKNIDEKNNRSLKEFYISGIRAMKESKNPDVENSIFFSLLT